MNANRAASVCEVGVQHFPLVSLKLVSEVLEGRLSVDTDLLNLAAYLTFKYDPKKGRHLYCIEGALLICL